MSLVRVGRLGRVHGLRGELFLEEVSLTPGEMRDIGGFVRQGREGEALPLTLASVRGVHGGLLVAFAEAPDRDRAAGLAGGELLADAARLPDPGPGVAYTFQLLGMEVRELDGRVLGTLADIWSTGAHPIYVVRNGRELLIPAHPGVLRDVDVEARVITVELPAGLEEL